MANNPFFHFLKPTTWSGYTIWISLIVVLWTTINTTFKKDYKEGIIEADGKGYYAYLPAVFIYHDLNFGFYNKIELEAYANPNLLYDYLRLHNNKTINKYYIGTAILLVPFFLTGHVITLVTGMPADGYSYYYTLMVHLGALFYFLLALVGLQKLLRSLRIEEKPLAITIAAIVFGTNLFYYVVTEFAMSHVYSFAAITWFCVTVREYFADYKSKHIVYSALLLGIITLIRPVNLLIVLAVPFLADEPKQLLSGFRSLITKSRPFVIALMCFLSVVSIQLVVYKISTGDFIVYSYKQEGFNFMNPQIMNFLFSYRKGMFVYTPLLFLSLAGFIYQYRKKQFQFYTLSGFLIALVYVFSSWHMWFYGGSFSQRVMIDFYAFFAILLATALQEMPAGKVKKLYIGFIVLFVIVCQIQTYQYRRMQIHWSDMTKEKYWEVFMRVDKL